MKQRPLPLLMFVFIVALSLPLLSGAVRRATATQAPLTQKCGAWSIIPTPPHKTLAAFGGVAIISPTDAWAVGVLGSYGSSNDATLTEHWNGSSWSVVKSPQVGNSSYLYAVSAVATNDVWAVGFSTQGYSSVSLILHWNGSQWSQVSSPGALYLTSIAAISANDVWAAGVAYNNGAATFIEHWNGSSWIAENDASTYGALFSISADSANDVWAVGLKSIYHSKATVIEHWNGSSWNYSSSSDNDELYGVTAISPSNVWAVGISINGPPNGVFIEHWNGKKWKVVPSPSVSNGQLNAITQVPGTNRLWAVGYQGGSSTQTLSEQWDGTKWSIVPTPIKGFASSELLSVAATDASHVWAVGTYITPSYINHPLAEFYC